MEGLQGQLKFTPDHLGEEQLTHPTDFGSFELLASCETEDGLVLTTTESQSRKPLLPILDYTDEEAVKISTQHTPMRVETRLERQEDKTLAVVIEPCTHDEYREYRDKPEVPKPTGTAMTVRTTEEDGSSKLLVQRRGRNYFYGGGIPGASVAGLWNAGNRFTVEPDGTITLLPVSTQHVVENIIEESEHEVYIQKDSYNNTEVITGYCRDQINPHDEILLSARTSLSSNQIIDNAMRKRFNTEQAESEWAFSEDFFFIDSTPEAIATLLTQVRCPLPPTHAAAFVQTGYLLILSQYKDHPQATAIANNWREKVRLGIRENYGVMDKMVERYYISNPQELSNIPQGKPQRNPYGYDAAYSPVQQGLPELFDELKRVGLLSDPQQITT